MGCFRLKGAEVPPLLSNSSVDVAAPLPPKRSTPTGEFQLLCMFLSFDNVWVVSHEPSRNITQEL